MKIKLQNVEMELEAPITVYEAAKQAELITREVIGAEIGGVTVALTQELKEGDEVKLLTFADDAGKHLFRHTASHILAQAVKRLYPAAKFTIGPAIDNGYYYDIDSEVPFNADALKALESEMKKIVKENLKIERFELPREEAIRLMQEKDEPYKVQLIEELPADAVISFYRQGEFTDLCAG
ncbi:MAG: threonine--tRNA ligase, partial [Clostridia bacterium]|nr:threonine--tRNA ligase [Clostridia bacterium]